MVNLATQQTNARTFNGANQEEAPNGPTNI